VVDAEGVGQRCGFARPLCVGEFVEREDAALRQVRPDGLEGVAGGLVEIEVEVGEGDDGCGNSPPDTAEVLPSRLLR
jgi:hypothetical protein